MKIKQNIIQSGHTFQITHTEYSLWAALAIRKPILLNIVNSLPDIDKIYLYAKDPYEAKYQYLINKREKVGLDHYKDFIEYLNDMQDVYKILKITMQERNVKC